MQQAVDAAQIDERAELGQGAHRPAHHHAFLQRPEGFFLGRALALFENHAAVDHHIFVGGVELGDAALDLLADQFFQLGLLRARRCGKPA